MTTDESTKSYKMATKEHKIIKGCKMITKFYKITTKGCRINIKEHKLQTNNKAK